MSDSLQKPIVRIWSIAGHGKGEVDHVGGIAKVTIRHVAGGFFFANSEDMVKRLKSRYADKTNPTYVFKEISCDFVEEERVKDKLKIYKTIDGSSYFQVCMSSPNMTKFKAVPYLCICDLCKDVYGSCPLLQEYEQDVENETRTKNGNVLLYMCINFS